MEHKPIKALKPGRVPAAARSKKRKNEITKPEKVLREGLKRNAKIYRAEGWRLSNSSKKPEHFREATNKGIFFLDVRYLAGGESFNSTGASGDKLKPPEFRTGKKNGIQLAASDSQNIQSPVYQ